MLERPVILALDRYPSAAILLVEAARILQEQESEVIGYIKVNDGLHKPDMSAPDVCSNLKRLGPNVGFFLDLKLADISQTSAEITRYYPSIDILTVSSMVTAKTLVELREALPTTKLALYSLPTDMSAEECQERYGKLPAEKIRDDVTYLKRKYNEIRSKELLPRPFELIVCSPQEVEELYRSTPGYGFICPGIRDEWMLKDHQERTTGIKEALERGATYVVLGSQMIKGNPQKGVSPRESREKTTQEIAMMELEGGGHA